MKQDEEDSMSRICKSCFDEDLAMDIKYYGKQKGLTKYAKIVSKKECDICSFEDCISFESINTTVCSFEGI